MLAEIVQCGWRPGFAEFASSGLAVLACEIVARIPLRLEEHCPGPLCAHGSIEPLNGNGTVQHALAEGQMVGDGSHIVLLAIAGSYGLGVEEVGVHEIDALRGQ